MPDSSSTIKPSGSQEGATPIKKPATQEKDMTAIQEANDDTHMSDDEEDEEDEEDKEDEEDEEDEDYEEDGTDHDDADVEEEEDGNEEEESEEGKKQDEVSEEESDKDAEDEGTKIGTTLQQSPVRSQLPDNAHRSSPVKTSRTSPIKAPRSSTPACSQSPFKAPRSSVKPSQPLAKVSDEAAEEVNRPKSSTSDVRRQAQTPELKPKRSQKAPLQPSPSKPSRPLPSRTTQPSPSKAGDIADFDWDAFEKRYDRALDEASHKETELLKEFDQLVQYFQVWAEASSSHDNERAVKRRVTRERRVNLSEEQLKIKKSHLTEVVTAFQSALALLNRPHMQI